MKEVLIIFIILLVLLLMVSLLGGSIRLKSDEHFDDDIDINDETLLPAAMKPWESHPSFVPQYKPIATDKEYLLRSKNGMDEKKRMTQKKVEDKVTEEEEGVVVEEALADAYDEYEKIPVHDDANESGTAGLYMSDPHEYDKKSVMEDVVPYTRMSDFAGFE